MLRSVSRRRNRVLKWRTAASAGLEVELVDQDEGALHSGADRPDRHRGARDVDDVLVDADRIQHGLALVLRIEPLRPHLAPLALPVHQDLDVGNLAVRRHADEVGDGSVLADGLLKDGVAVNLAVGFRLEGAEALFGEFPADPLLDTAFLLGRDPETLGLDALGLGEQQYQGRGFAGHARAERPYPGEIGRSTRLNSSHANTSYEVFILDK